MTDKTKTAVGGDADPWSAKISDAPMTNLTALLERAGSLHEKLAASHPSLTRGQVWCRACGHTQRVDSAQAMRTGWPKCCGCTMTIDSPEEAALLASLVEEE